MLTAVRLGGYLGALGVVFGVAWGAGSAVAPAPAPEQEEVHEEPALPLQGAGTRTADGLASAGDGVALAPARIAFVADRTADLAFTVTGPDRRPLTAFTPGPDGVPLRLVVVRRDGTGLQLLYPAMAPDGTWSVPLRLPTAGAWRALAEFTPAGAAPQVLGTDLFVPGDFTPVGSAPTRAAEVDDYQVRLDGELRAGEESALFATVSRDGRAVTDLEPERGAFGTVVALRSGDLAVAPVVAQTRAAPTDRSGPGIAFTATLPTEGTYRVFLVFRHAGELHTAAFTVATTGASGAPREPVPMPMGGDR